METSWPTPGMNLWVFVVRSSLGTFLFSCRYRKKEKLIEFQLHRRGSWVPRWPPETAWWWSWQSKLPSLAFILLLWSKRLDFLRELSMWSQVNVCQVIKVKLLLCDHRSNILWSDHKWALNKSTGLNILIMICRLWSNRWWSYRHSPWHW